MNQIATDVLASTKPELKQWKKIVVIKELRGFLGGYNFFEYF